MDLASLSDVDLDTLAATVYRERMARMTARIDSGAYPAPLLSEVDNRLGLVNGIQAYRKRTGVTLWEAKNVIDFARREATT